MAGKGGGGWAASLANLKTLVNVRGSYFLYCLPNIGSSGSLFYSSSSEPRTLERKWHCVRRRIPPQLLEPQQQHKRQ